MTAKFDADRWTDIYSDMLGIDPELIIDPHPVATVRKARSASVRLPRERRLLQRRRVILRLRFLSSGRIVRRTLTKKLPPFPLAMILPQTNETNRIKRFDAR